MLIAEELFLLLRRDDGKPESATTYRGYGLAAALLTDLVLAGRITLSDEKDPRMSVLQPGPVGHPALDAAMTRLEQRDGRKLSSLVTDGKLAREAELAQALLAAGVISVEEKRALGLVPERYPVVDAEPERRVRERLRAVLLGGTPRRATRRCSPSSKDWTWPQRCPGTSRAPGARSSSRSASRRCRATSRPGTPWARRSRR